MIKYVFGACKGDYLNIGASAEIGIYTKDSEFNTGKLDQYFAKTSLAMPMELYLYNYENSDNINNIFSWNPEAPQWWITGFNPDYIYNVDVTKQVVVRKIDFTGRKTMYDEFKKFLDENNLNQNTNINTFILFDDDSNTICDVCSKING